MNKSKISRYCLARKECDDLSQKYGSEVAPICPVLVRIAKKWDVEKWGVVKMPHIPTTDSQVLDCIQRVNALFGGFIIAKPTENLVAFFAHRENCLRDCIDIIRNDIESLFLLLERDFPNTVKKIVDLFKELEATEFFYIYNKASNGYVYLRPPQRATTSWLEYLVWRKGQITLARCEQGDSGLVNKLTCTFPAEAVEVMGRIYDELSPLESFYKKQQQQKKDTVTNTGQEDRTKPTMSLRFKKADDSYKDAMAMATNGGTELRTEKQVHDWLLNNGCSQYDDNGLPNFETWERYLRGARKYRMNQQATALKSVPNITR